MKYVSSYPVWRGVRRVVKLGKPTWVKWGI